MTRVFFSQLACNEMHNVKLTHYQVLFTNAQMVPIVCQRSPITLGLCDLGNISGVTFSHGSTFLEQFLQRIGTDQLFLNSKHLYLFPTYFSLWNIAIIVFIEERERERKKKKEERKQGRRGRGKNGVGRERERMKKREKKKRKEERSPNYHLY